MFCDCPATAAGVGASGLTRHAIILETAVGRARVGRHGVGRQGVTTRQADACKKAQRRQRAPGRRNRVRSALIPPVSKFVGAKISTHAALPAFVSGPLRFLGYGSVADCTLEACHEITLFPLGPCRRAGSVALRLRLPRVATPGRADPDGLVVSAQP